MLQTPSQKTLQQVLLKVVNSQIGSFISIPFPKKCTKSLSVNNLTLWRKNYTDSDFFQFYNYKIKIKLHIYWDLATFNTYTTLRPSHPHSKVDRVSKGNSILEGFFYLVPYPKNCAKSLFSTFQHKPKSW